MEGLRTEGQDGREGPVLKKLIPWQRKSELGFFKAFWQTLQQVLISPRKFFDDLDPQGPVMEPLFFAMCAGIIPIGIQTLLNPRGFLGSLVAIPLVAVAVFVQAAVMHLIVRMFGGKGGFGGTFHVLAYGSATMIFSVIPIIGGAISVIWQCVVGVIGYRRIHRFGVVRGILAYCFIPLVALSVGIAAALLLPGLMKSRAAYHSAPPVNITVPVFQPVAGKQTVTTAQPKVASKSFMNGFKRPGCKVDGIIYSQNDSIAMINGNPYRLNDSVCGGTITGITANTVKIKSQDGEQEYRLKS